MPSLSTRETQCTHYTESNPAVFVYTDARNAITREPARRTASERQPAHQLSSAGALAAWVHVAITSIMTTAPCRASPSRRAVSNYLPLSSGVNRNINRTTNTVGDRTDWFVCIGATRWGGAVEEGTRDTFKPDASLHECMLHYKFVGSGLRWFT